MFLWCAILFVLGIAAFLDSILNLYGDLFRQINSVFFMLISLGLLVRTSTKKSEGRMENYENRVENLELQVKQMKRMQEQYTD
jgi:hypothetical protein